MTTMTEPMDVSAQQGPAAALDEFGRHVGWSEIPPEPAEAPSSIEQVSLDPVLGVAYAPSPEDWRDEVFYAVIIDRFNRAAPFSTWGGDVDERSRHGGNIRGLIERLDYIQGLGVTTLLVNPVVMNPPAGYHQYWTVHFMAVDPHIGTMAEFKRLAAEVHKRGMRLVLDMVFNHTAPLLEYQEGFSFGRPKSVKRWRYALKPVELQREEHFTRRGDINDWDDPEQIRVGDLPGGINRLDTENPATQDILLKIAKWWIKETDIDGFRLDVYKHVASSFWNRFFPEVRAYASGLGKKNFLLMGELYDGDAGKLAPEIQEGRLDSAYNYPAFYANQAALRGEEPTRSLEENFLHMKARLGDSIHRLAQFLGNHDLPRFLRPNVPKGVLQFALAHTLLSTGIPYIYYGDEQAFLHSPGKEWLDLEVSRDDMFRVQAPVEAHDPAG